MAVSRQLVSLYIAPIALPLFFVVTILDFQGSSQHLESVVVTRNFVVAFAESCEKHRMVKFTIFELRQFGVFLECKSEVVDRLLVALEVEICLSHVMMGDRQPELRFSVGVHQNLRATSTTLLRANSFILSFTISSSLCYPMRLTTASNLLSKSALMVSA